MVRLGRAIAAGLGCCLMLAISSWTPSRAQGQLPPPTGPEEPRVLAEKGFDGIYHQSWFAHSLLNLKEDFAEARAQGKRLVFVTNNSTKSRAGYLGKFTGLGLNVNAVRRLV